MDYYVALHLPKSVTSIPVSGKPLDVFHKVQNWLSIVTSGWEFKNAHLTFYVPTTLLDQVDKNLLVKSFGEYRVSGKTQKYPSGEITTEWWEFNIKHEDIPPTLEFIKNNAKQFADLNPTLYLSYDFRLKGDDDKKFPSSNIILCLKNRSSIMPDIVFPFDESSEFYSYFENFCSITPFKVRGKHLRKYKLGGQSLVGKKLIGYG